MSNSSNKTLQKIIQDKQLVEIFLHGAPTYKVAYLLAIYEDFITFAEVSSSATFSGVILCRLSDIDWIGTDTLYTHELSKQILDDSIYKQAQENVKHIKKFSPSGFFDAFKGTKTIVELTDSEENAYAGRIVDVGHNPFIILDEYSSEFSQRVSRKYMNVANLSRFAVNVPWLRTITRTLADRNL